MKLDYNESYICIYKCLPLKRGIMMYYPHASILGRHLPQLVELYELFSSLPTMSATNLYLVVSCFYCIPRETTNNRIQATVVCC